MAETIDENDITCVGDGVHYGMTYDLDDIGAFVEIVPAQHLRANPYRRVLWAFAVEIKHLGIVPESKGGLVGFPERIDGFGHTGWTDVTHIGKIFVLSLIHI